MTNFRIGLLLLSLLGFSAVAWADRLPFAYPEEVGMSSARLAHADRVIEEAIRQQRTPGAVLAVVRKGKLAYLKAYGHRQVIPQRLPMVTHTVFDIASCTKPTATAMAVLILMERGLVRGADAVNMYIPHFKSWRGEGKDTITIRIKDLLTHTSGLPAYAPVGTLQQNDKMPHPQKLIDYIALCKRHFKPGTDVQYSCLNYIALQHIVERVSQQSLRDFCAQNIFEPLGMHYTDFIPCRPDKKGVWITASQPRWAKDEQDKGAVPIAPTEQQPDGSILLGQVHDPLARVLNGGISGNAGLFSTAEDLALLCAMLQNNGEWNGKQILSPTAVKAMRTVPADLASFGRSLGWDVASAYSSNKGDLLSSEAYGHTGYTGTSIVIDPINDLSIILLCNSVHPADRTNVIRMRSLVSNAVAAAITDHAAPFSTHYYDRIRLFQSQPTIKHTDIVMLGNSITEGGGNWTERLGITNVINRGISGDETMGVYQRLHQILPAHPAKLFLKIGVNDISHDLSTDTIVDRIGMIVERIRHESPQTKLYLQSLLPIRESTGRWKRLTGKTQQIPEINTRLARLAKEKKINFINLFPLFTEPGTIVLRKELTTDGLHLSDAGYEVWSNELKKVLKQ